MIQRISAAFQCLYFFFSLSNFCLESVILFHFDIKRNAFFYNVAVAKQWISTRRSRLRIPIVCLVRQPLPWLFDPARRYPITSLVYSPRIIAYERVLLMKKRVAPPSTGEFHPYFAGCKGYVEYLRDGFHIDVYLYYIYLYITNVSKKKDKDRLVDFRANDPLLMQSNAPDRPKRQLNSENTVFVSAAAANFIGTRPSIIRDTLTRMCVVERSYIYTNSSPRIRLLSRSWNKNALHTVGG